MLLRPDCTEPACQKSWCLPLPWARLFQFPTPILIWEYMSQRQYINRQITMPLPESNLSAELCLKNKKPLQTVCAYRYIEPDAVFPLNGWDCEAVLYCWTFSFLMMITGISALFHLYVNLKADNYWESIQEGMNTFSFQNWWKAMPFYATHH